MPAQNFYFGPQASDLLTQNPHDLAVGFGGLVTDQTGERLKPLLHPFAVALIHQPPHVAPCSHATGVGGPGVGTRQPQAARNSSLITTQSV